MHVTGHKKKKVSFHIVAPAIIDDGPRIRLGQAVFCYNNTERNPHVYWGADVHFENAYTCIEFNDIRSLAMFTDSYLRRIQKRDGIRTINFDKMKIIQVTRTAIIVETMEIISKETLVNAGLQIPKG